MSTNSENQEHFEPGDRNCLGDGFRRLGGGLGVRLAAFAGSLLMVGLVVSAPARAQLGPACTASVLNRTVQVNDDGSFFIGDVPAEPGLFRVRVECTPMHPSPDTRREIEEVLDEAGSYLHSMWGFACPERLGAR